MSELRHAPAAVSRIAHIAAALALLGAPAAVAQAQAQAQGPGQTRTQAASTETAAFDEPNQQSDVSTLDLEEERPTGFLADTSFVIKPRTYYLNRDRDTNQDNVGFAAGGGFQYLSGWAWDRLQVRATLYTSQVVHGESDKDGTLLFLPGPEGFSVLGEANAVVRVTDAAVARVGRQLFELPYLGSHDIRMVPNTFEAVAFGNSSSEGLAYIVAYVDGIKRKNDDDFIPMAEAAGVTGGDDGVTMAGVRYVWNDTEISAIDQQTSDVFNTFFAKFERKFTLANDQTLKAFVQYTDQTSIGSDLIGNFDTSLLSAKVEWNFGQTTLRLAGSSTGSERGIQKPYGNPANYLSVIVDDFDRAGEDAWMVGGNHNFGRIGRGDLSLFANIVQGDTPDSGSTASPDETEYDLTTDYRFKEGPANRLWIRLRAAYIDQDEAEGGDDFLDFRIIVNWDLTTRLR